MVPSHPLCRAVLECIENKWVLLRILEMVLSFRKVNDCFVTWGWCMLNSLQKTYRWQGLRLSYDPPWPLGRRGNAALMSISPLNRSSLLHSVLFTVYELHWPSNTGHSLTQTSLLNEVNIHNSCCNQYRQLHLKASSFPLAAELQMEK